MSKSKMSAKRVEELRYLLWKHEAELVRVEERRRQAEDEERSLRAMIASVRDTLSKIGGGS